MSALLFNGMCNGDAVSFIMIQEFVDYTFFRVSGSWSNGG